MVQRWAAAIGGPYAITVWSWLVTFPFALVVGVSGGILLGKPMGLWLLAVVAVQLVLIVPLGLARLLLLPPRPRRARPVTALGVFAFVGASRALLLASVAMFMGDALSARFIVGWLVAGAVYGIFALSAVAIVISGMRQHRDAMQRLAEVETSLSTIRDIDSTRRHELEQVFVTEVEGSVATALAGIRGAGLQTKQEVSQALRTIAAEIVRPLSHRLVDSDGWDAVLLAPSPTVVPRQERTRLLLGQMRPASPVLLVAVIELLALPFLLERFGPAFAVMNVIVGGGALLAGSWLVLRLWPKGGMTGTRFVALVLAYAAAGAVASGVVGLADSLVGLGVPFFWTTIVFVPAAGLAISLMAALERRRDEVERDLSGLISREALETAQLRASLAHLRRRLAKVLHSAVQSEFIASALTLAAQQDQSQRAVDEELDRLAESVRSRVRLSDAPTQSARERVDGLVEVWTEVLGATLDSDEQVWLVLDEDMRLQDRVVDIVAEGLANAVRHGSGSGVSVGVRWERPNVLVTVASPGALVANPSAGLGSRVLAESADTWSLADTDGWVHLTARCSRGT